jgi:tricarballylate dehydrogenase
VHNFLETIRDFNTATKLGVFDPFKLDGLATDAFLTIPKSNWALPITKAPFVACGVTFGITFTYGGVKTDAQPKVMNNEGLPMPGRWAVGEISGGFIAFNYLGGVGLTKGAVFGRIAEEAAAGRARATDQANGTM